MLALFLKKNVLTTHLNTVQLLLVCRKVGKEIGTLATSLTTNTSLVSLNIREIYADAASSGVLASVLLLNTTLKHLDVFAVHMNHANQVLIAQALKANRSLKTFKC